jgi:hypothetical protein
MVGNCPVMCRCLDTTRAGGYVCYLQAQWGHEMPLLALTLPSLTLQVSDSPMSLFGFKPASLIGLPMARFIDVFQALSSETEELIAKMIMKVRMGVTAHPMGWMGRAPERASSF